jgi:hypothetical protein
MGRWAYFHGDSGVEYEYKFWFGIQSSDIPWANCFEELYIPEYDEDKATDIEMSEAQKEIWKEWADSHTSEEGHTAEVLDVLQNVGYVEYGASDECTEEELQERWAEVNSEARALDLELFTQNDGESPEDAVDRYYENVIHPSYKSKDEADEEAALANLYLKTVICAMMPKFGYNYSCHYEC